MNFYRTYGESFSTSSFTRLDDASLLDLSTSGSHSLPVKNLEVFERQARNLVSVNSHADLFATAGFQYLSSETMDTAMLTRFLEALARCLRHSVSFPSCWVATGKEGRRHKQLQDTGWRF